MSRERRKSPRFEIEIDAESRHLHDSDVPKKQVVTKNVSSRGAYLLTEDPPEPGDVLVVSAGSSLDLKAVVKRVDRLNEDLFGFAVVYLDPESQGNSGSPEAHFRKAWMLELKELEEESFEERARLKRVQDFVKENYSESITLSRAAKVAALEATYFSALFHEKTGVTFSDWIQYIRVANALEMMSKGDYSVSEVAYAVGFENLRTFERTFKKWTNMNPRTFKKLCRPDVV